MNKFLWERYKLPRLTQEKKEDNKNNHILIHEIEFVVKNICTKETSDPDIFFC